MGHKERRLQEKKAMKRLILDSAMELVSKKGLCALTIRSLADQIEYSPSIIYEYFESKESICKELCAVICCELLCASKKVDRGSNPDKYLLNLVRANVDFLNKKPQGIELLTLVCFGPDPSQIPKEFLETVGTFFKCFKKVQLQTAPNSKTD